MIVKLLTEHHLVFLSLIGGCRSSSESTLVIMSNCWKSHAAAQIWYFHFDHTPLLDRSQFTRSLCQLSKWYDLCRSVCFYLITEHTVHLLPTQLQKGTPHALIIIEYEILHRGLTQSQCGVILYDSCQWCFMKRVTGSLLWVNDSLQVSMLMPNAGWKW